MHFSPRQSFQGSKLRCNLRGIIQSAQPCPYIGCLGSFGRFCRRRPLSCRVSNVIEVRRHLRRCKILNMRYIGAGMSLAGPVVVAAPGLLVGVTPVALSPSTATNLRTNVTQLCAEMCIARVQKEELRRPSRRSYTCGFEPLDGKHPENKCYSIVCGDMHSKGSERSVAEAVTTLQYVGIRFESQTICLSTSATEKRYYH